MGPSTSSICSLARNLVSHPLNSTSDTLALWEPVTSMIKAAVSPLGLSYWGCASLFLIISSIPPCSLSMIANIAGSWLPLLWAPRWAFLSWESLASSCCSSCSLQSWACSIHRSPNPQKFPRSWLLFGVSHLWTAVVCTIRPSPKLKLSPGRPYHISMWRWCPDSGFSWTPSRNCRWTCTDILYLISL